MTSPTRIVCALTFALLAITASVVESQMYTCYQCCNMPTSSTPTCTNATACIKSYAAIGGASATVRDCVTMSNSTGCQSISIATVCVCQGNLCNTATHESPFGVAMTVAAGLAVAVLIAARQ